MGNTEFGTYVKLDNKVPAELLGAVQKVEDHVLVSRMDEVLDRAMTRKPEPIAWDETATTQQR